jgi:hypothetical protein
MLLLGSILPSLTTSAQSTGSTTLYFSQYSIDTLEGELIKNIPTTQNDSEWPPKLLDWEKILPRISREGFENWLIWMEYYILVKLSEGLFDEDNYSGYEGFEDLFPSPFELKNTYFYDGDETIEIQGDVTFDLYFTSTLSLQQDQVNIKIIKNDFIIFNDYEKNSTITIKSSSPKQIKKYSATIENVNISLEPGDTLTAAVEIIPADKRLAIFADRLDGFGINGSRLLSFVERWANWANNSNREKAQQRGQTVKEIFSLLNEFNITINITTITDIFNVLRTSSFIYNSQDHPSSINLPTIVPGEDIRTYFLHDNNQMDEIRPSGADLESTLGGTPITWEGPSLERSKILKNASASLFINSLNLIPWKKISVTATLTDREHDLASSTVQIPKDLLLITKPKEPITFLFNDINKEIEYDNSVTLGVALSNGTTSGPLTRVKLLHGSEDYPSSLMLQFIETDHIRFQLTSIPEDGLIVPGDTVEYRLNISSELADEVDVKILEDEVGEWDVDIIDDLPIQMQVGETTEVHVIVQSTEDKKIAYEDEEGHRNDLAFIVSGKTGWVRKKSSVEVSRDAIEYDVNIVGYTESKNIKKGGTGIFYFVIENNNTGAVDDVDSYSISAISENGWIFESTEDYPNLKRGSKSGAEEILVAVEVPDNTSKKEDNIIFSVESDSGDAVATVNVTVVVLEEGIVETIMEYLEAISERLGFDEFFGDNGPYIVAALPIIIIVIIVIILMVVFRRKFVEIICTDRIQEIDPNEPAEFDITLQNPSKKPRTYEITADGNMPMEKWTTTIEPEHVTIDGHQSQLVTVKVTPSNKVEPKEWSEVNIVVKKPGKKKKEELTTMLMVKEGKPILQIADVFTWPKVFHKGNRVLTSFRLYNKGTISARNVQVLFYINGRQKNKVTVSVPSGGYADIRIPWITQKGKNKLLIKTNV